MNLHSSRPCQCGILNAREALATYDALQRGEP